MVVTAGALHPQAEKNIARGVGDVVEDVVPLRARVAIVVFVNPVPQVARGRERARIAGEEFIARELLGDESIIRRVSIECRDGVLAVAPGVGPVIVDAIAVAVRVAHEVEPPAGHAFPVARRIEQAINQCRRGRVAGTIPPIRNERLHFLRCRRQAREAKAHPSDEGGWFRLRRGRESLASQSVAEEAVHFITLPRLVINSGRRH